MDIKTALFYVFAVTLLFASFRVITARNPVHAALFLVLAFFQAAGVWVLLKAEFLAITLVLVYVGAVMVLFLFVVMMLDINLDTVRRGFWKNMPLAATIGAVIVFEMASLLLDAFRNTEEVKQVPTLQTGLGQVGAPVSNTKDLGRLLYSDYLYPLEIAAIILLVGIIAAIALTLRTRKDSKYVSPGDQVRVRARDRVEVLKLDATTAPVEQVKEGGQA